MTTTVLAVGLAAMAGTVAALALRLAGAKSALAKARLAHQGLEAQLQTTAREFSQYRRRCDYQLEAMRSDVAELEADLSRCSGPGDVRKRLERLLAKASARQNGGDAPRLPGPPTPGADPGSDD